MTKYYFLNIKKASKVSEIEIDIDIEMDVEIKMENEKRNTRTRNEERFIEKRLECESTKFTSHYFC